MILSARALIMPCILILGNTPYYAECGVLSVVYCVQALPQPPLDKRNRLHTFYFRIPNEELLGKYSFL